MIPAARLGDMHQCPIKGHGTTAITSASGDTLIDGFGAARVGDVCGCGAVITQGFPAVVINGRPLAYLGSETSHGGRITTGSPDTFGGFTMSGSGAIVDFARLGAIDTQGQINNQILSQLLEDPHLEQLAENQNALVNPDATETANGQPTNTLQHEQEIEQKRAAQQEEQSAALSLIEPGFHIVQESMSRSALEELLFDSPSPALLAHFKHLNPHLGEWLKPGQMAIISDPDNRQCTRKEAQLMEAAGKVETALQELSDDEAMFMLEHYDVLGSFIGYSGAGLSISTLMAGRHLDSISHTLTNLEQLHQNSYTRYGHLRHESFFNQRRILMAQLDNGLLPLVRKGAGIPDHPKLKHALGISSRSLVHHWDQAGVAGEIPGYTNHIEGISRTARYIKRGSWAALALSAVASERVIAETCRVGREDECRHVKFTERGRFSGTVIGGAVGSAMIGRATAGALCIAVGVPTVGMGTLACGVLVAAAASTVGAAYGEQGGELAGELIYRLTE
ncbi:Zn-binding Pro-Ala-Ala-Arg (PAAR) domain-containing protein, incolved in TypeVI secretion [Halopseudomonas litoralis]|uniref:Zn-binding Pro-Ala-Ala-Arg (PAAR) domain-containing protein, incolved in TypeVI secretion n=1 Tax=Halopseudomonas litoralis TaxID=797277 RepID=A0A1H1XC67_9GAMM|nr:PAAR domain-containing protein [Halopseudomonas litoralis]SDT06914.1 Zn-binding Pro-Ala-Ala-Arg (PAAR) domain-containing protein, incolved in TypeVI secretion [Halopseudomonas litoralis]